MSKKLERSSTDKAFMGVCGGIANFFGISSFIVRLIFFVFPALSVVYIILAYFLPEDRSL